METSTSGGGKICISCGEDCSQRRRLRDREGRYLCAACHERLNAAPGSTPESDPDEAGPLIDLLDDIDEIALRPCEECGFPFPGSARICTKCGYDRVAGRRLEARLTVEEAKGPTISDEERRRREHNRRQLRMEYLKPLGMIAVGVPVRFALEHHLWGEEEAIAYLISYAVSVPFGLAVFWLCSLTWLGFDAPFHLNGLRLAGVYAVTDLAALGMSMCILPNFANWLVVLVVYIGLLMSMLDLDLADALLVAVVTLFAKVIVVLALMMWVFGAAW